MMFFFRKNMLFIKSKPEEILYHINQVETLLLSREDLDKMNRFILLTDFAYDESTLKNIKDDLPDSKWVEETQKIITTYNNKTKRNESLKKHIRECKNFIVYRYLEEKCSSANIEAFQQIGSWIFNEVDLKRDEKSRWVSQKFLRNFEFSDMPEKLKQNMQDNWLEINLKWLHQNKDIFFSNDIFKDIKKMD